MTHLTLACVALLLQDPGDAKGLKAELKLSHTEIRRASVRSMSAVLRLQNTGAKPLYLSVADWDGGKAAHGNDECEWVVNGVECRRIPSMWCIALRLQASHFILLAPGEVRERPLPFNHLEFTSDGKASIQYRFKSLRSHEMWDTSRVADLVDKTAILTVLSSEATVIVGDADVLAPAPAPAAPAGVGRLDLDGKLFFDSLPRVEVRVSNPGADEVVGPNLKQSTRCETCLADALQIEVQTLDGKAVDTLRIGFLNAQNPCRGESADTNHASKFSGGAEARVNQFFEGLNDLKEGCYRFRPVLATGHGATIAGAWKPFGWIPPDGE